MLSLHKIIIFFYFFLILTKINSLKTFCSSHCSYSFNDCTGIAQNNCARCAPSIFNTAPDPSATIPLSCSLKTTVKEIGRDLPDSLSVMNLSTFVVSNSTNQTCGIYKISGRYIDKDYISKNYTNFTIGHYQAIVRFSIAYVGTWSARQYLNFQAVHGYGSSNTIWNYSCLTTEFLCSNTGLDCL